MKIKIFLFLLLFSESLPAQQSTDTLKNILVDVTNTTQDYFNIPKRYETKDWLIFSGILAAGVIASKFDKDVKDFAIQPAGRNDIVANIFKIDNYYGTGEGLLAVAGITYLSGIAFKSESVKQSAIMIGESALYSSLFTHVLKRVIGRGRPYTGDDQYKFIGFNLWDYDYHSVPSGHTTCAFAVSTVVAGLTDNYFLKALAYLPAITTAYARLYHNQHWFSDVIFGAGIGYFTGVFVLDKHLNKRGVSVGLMNNENGILLNFKFYL